MDDHDLSMYAVGQERLAADCEKELKRVVATSGMFLDLKFDFDPLGPDQITLGVYLSPGTLNPIGNFWLVSGLVDGLRKLSGLTALSQLFYRLSDFSCDASRRKA